MLDGINRHMRAIIRLAETRAALKVYISKQELVTYEDLAEVLGVSIGKGFMDTLAAVSRDDHNNGRPICPSIVVSTKESFPGKGFFDHATRTGARHYQDDEDDDADVTTGNTTLTKEYHLRMVFWLEQLHKLGYDIVEMASGNTDHDLPDIDVALATKVVADLNTDDYGDEDDEDEGDDEDEEPGETGWDEDDDSTDG
jgi:hypothetical protein